MKYIPERMAKKSRFCNFVNLMSIEQRNKIFCRLKCLIEENKEYADKKNYGHLCNLLTSLALVQVFINDGMSSEQSQKTVVEAMYEYLKPKGKSMKKIAKHKWFVPFLKLFMPISFKQKLGYGWNIEFPDKKSSDFKMVTYDCIYAQIFTKYGMPEMTKNFCKVDDILYGNLPNTDFMYTEQIGNGGSMCDYVFRRRGG